MARDILPDAEGQINFPPITYKGTPVITTEMLAQAYGCSAKNIRDNFANNRERFIEGKHFYSLANGELQAFRDCTEIFGAVVPPRTRNLTIYTERGALQHAKSIGTDETWAVYDVLVETFFRTSQHATPEPSRVSKRTDPERKALTAIINTWVGMAPIHYANARAQVNAHFGVASVDALTVAQVKEAIQWVQSKIDALPPAREQAALPPVPKKDKFEAYLEEVEAFRARTDAEIRRLLGEGLNLVDIYKFGPEGIRGFSSIFHNWLHEVAVSPSPLVASCWSMDRAIEYSPLYLVREMEKILPDLRCR